MKNFLFAALLLCVIPSFALAAPAPKPLAICITKSGAIQAKTKCSKTETLLSTAGLQTLSIKGDVGSQGPRGDQGPKGDPGLKGDQGSKGEGGASAFSTMPSGTTVRGIISVGTSSNMVVAFPAPIPQSIGASDVMIAVTSAVSPANGCTTPGNCLAASEIAKNIACTGTADLPTAPVGKVCIYPKTFVRFGADQLAASNVFPYVNSSSTSIYGFMASAGAYITYGGTWAYTAP